MTGIVGKSVEPWGYSLAKAAYETLPNKVGQAVKKLGGSDSIARFAKQQVSTDFHEFASASFGKKFKMLLAEPSRGTLLLLLYPGTMGPRMYRAYQRGKKDNDFREVKDVLRRDGLAITLFVFALSPIVRMLSQGVQKLSGVNLLNKAKTDVLKYSQFQNYEISNAKVLQAILDEGNGEGLKKAVASLTNRGLEKDSLLARKIDKIKEAVPVLVDRYEAYKAANQANKGKMGEFVIEGWKKTKSPFERVNSMFQKADKLTGKALAQARESGSKGVVKTLENLSGEFTGVLKNYAKTRRLPSDVVSFAIVIGAIGYFPVWLNGYLNKRAFEKEQKTNQAKAEAKPALPPLAQPTAFGVTRPTQPFPATPWGQVQPYRAPQNYFNRSV